MSLRIFKRKGSPYHYVRGTIRGHQVYESTETTDRKQAEEYLQHCQSRLYLDKVLRAGVFEAIPAEIDRELAILRDRSNNRSQKRGDTGRVTLNNLRVMYVKQRGRCAVSGIEFRLDCLTDGDERSRAFAPSVDRISNDIGYTLKNIRLVCRIANYAMNTWGEAALRALCQGVVNVWEQACLEQFQDCTDSGESNGAQASQMVLNG